MSENNLIWQDRKHHLWFPLSFTRYYIEDDRLIIKEGFLNTTINETLLYRIIDITFRQSLAGKIFGTGDIILKAKADATPEIVLKNVGKPVEVRSMFSKMIEESRDRRNIVGKEFYSTSHVDVDNDGIFDTDEPQT